MSDHDHEWTDATTYGDADRVEVCVVRGCGVVRRTSPTGRTTITHPDDPTVVTGL